MTFTDYLVRAAPAIAAVVLTPLLLSSLSRLAPPRKNGISEGAALEAKFGKLEVCSQLAAMVGMFAGIGVGFALGKNTPWMIGTLFGGMVASPVAMIAIVTLRHGRTEWDGFWLFYGWKYKISLRLIFPVYGFFIVVGLISLIALLV